MKWAKLSLVALIILIGCKEDLTKTAFPGTGPDNISIQAVSSDDKAAWDRGAFQKD